MLPPSNHRVAEEKMPRLIRNRRAAALSALAAAVLGAGASVAVLAAPLATPASVLSYHHTTHPQAGVHGGGMILAFGPAHTSDGGPTT
jgi:hypothetical protein